MDLLADDVMRILFVVDRPPLPARDGVTIPMSGLLDILKSIGNVTLIISADLGRDFERIIEEQKLLAGDVDVIYIERHKKSPVRGVFSEIFAGIPYFHNWDYRVSFDDLEIEKADLIVVSPINVIDVGIKLKERYGACLFAAISDVFTSFLRCAAYSNSWRNNLRTLLMHLRGVWFARIERHILGRCERVFVQTVNDVRWLGVIGGDALMRKGVAFSNGVNDKLISMESCHQEPPEPVALFLANFSDPHYREMLRWVLDNVWPAVKNKVSGVKLRIVGKGVDADPVVLDALLADTSIEYLGFVDSLEEAYRGVRVSIAPIFKGYGFINKVAESLAAGVPVVGDRSAFNGMEDYLSDTKLCLATTASEFIENIAAYLVNDEIWRGDSLFAKNYAIGNLTWASKLAIFRNVLKECQ